MIEEGVVKLKDDKKFEDAVAELRRYYLKKEAEDIEKAQGMSKEKKGSKSQAAQSLAKLWAPFDSRISSANGSSSVVTAPN